jgi:hypothetical protein
VGNAGFDVSLDRAWFAGHYREARDHLECVLALFQPDRHKELAFPQKARNCGPSLATKPKRRSM